MSSKELDLAPPKVDLDLAPPKYDISLTDDDKRIINIPNEHKEISTDNRIFRCICHRIFYECDCGAYPKDYFVRRKTHGSN